MKITGKIAMIVAGLILCAHSILPHSHDNSATQGTQIEISSTLDSFLEHLQQALLLNHGSNHLEEYQGASHLMITDIVKTVHFDFEIPYSADVAHHRTAYTNHFIPILNHPNNFLRGPPLV